MRKTELVSIKAHDQYELSAKIDYPGEGDVSRIVVFCQGTGPGTYDLHRQVEDVEFDYFELFASEFCRRGIGLCRWNTRGCTPSSEPPLYVDIDREQYSTYRPRNTIQDIVSIVRYVRNMEPFKNARLILLGQSEGATLAPFAARQCPEVDALLLMGFSCGNMRDIMDWQLSGGSSMVHILEWFDYDHKGYVSREDFDNDVFGARALVYPDTGFEELDKNGDGKLTQEDFADTLSDYKKQVFDAIEKGDDDWLMTQYDVPITSGWALEHFEMPSAIEPLLQLEIPVTVFRGENDANIPSSDIEALAEAVQGSGKKNIIIKRYPSHDHDMNYLFYPLRGEISFGLLEVFDAAEKV